MSWLKTEPEDYESAYCVGEKENYWKMEEFDRYGDARFHVCKECGETTPVRNLRDYGHSHREECSLAGDTYE